MQLGKHVIQRPIALYRATPPGEDLHRGIAQAAVQAAQFEAATAYKTGRVRLITHPKQKTAHGLALARVPTSDYVKRVQGMERRRVAAARPNGLAEFCEGRGALFSCGLVEFALQIDGAHN